MNWKLMIFIMIMTFLCSIGGMTLTGWGAYVACHDGGGHLLNGWRPAWVCISNNATIPVCMIPGQPGYYNRPIVERDTTYGNINVTINYSYI